MCMCGGFSFLGGFPLPKDPHSTVWWCASFFFQELNGQVVDFLTASDLDLGDLNEVLDIRRRRAASRADALEQLIRIFDVGHRPTITIDSETGVLCCRPLKNGRLFLSSSSPHVLFCLHGWAVADGVIVFVQGGSALLSSQGVWRGP